MMRQRVSLLGVAIVAVSAVMWAASPALAQRGGGGGHGGGGGGHGGGSGGFHAGSGSAAFHSSGMGHTSTGFHSFPAGGSQGGFAVARHFPGGNRPGFYGGYPRIYGGYYGGLYWGGAYDSAYYVGPSTESYVYTAPATADYQAYYPPEETPTDPTTASLTVRVPAEAEIWFDDRKTTQTGMGREFVTPPLSPDRSYSYMIRARWTAANGKVFDQAHKISFRAGQAILVDFLTPPGASGSRPPAMEKAR